MKDSIERIESSKFCAEVNVFSSLSSFLTAIQTDHAVQTLIHDMRLGDGWVDVLARIRYLLDLPFDEEYENPYDVALATYVFSLFLFEHWAGYLAAQWAATAKSTWWTQRVIELLIRDEG